MADSITPSPELVTSLRNSAPHGIRDAGVTRELWLINQAYAAGADQELEACCEYVYERLKLTTVACIAQELRTARRPKPPSLKEQALEQLACIQTDLNKFGMGISTNTIRRALEALPND
jgi:hypothetical protein